MSEYEFRIALIEVLREMINGVSWPASEHASFLLYALEWKVEEERARQEGIR